jgi:hypothetical protein
MNVFDTIPRKSATRSYQRVPITNREGRVTFKKSEFIHCLRSDWHFLLDPQQMHNLCFYFECPISHKDYNEANSNEGLENLGPFASVRWKYIAEIHVLFPGELGHIYVARKADLPHYQEVFSKFVAALEAYNNDRLSIFLYLRGEDYQNFFLTVLNKTETVKPFIERMDWMEVQRIS